MNRREGSLLPWLIAGGAISLAWMSWRRTHQPYYPDLALQTGLELLSHPRRVLAIGPHPDDLESFAGGTLKLLSLNGSSVTMAVLSRGEQATRRANIAQIRSREAESSAAILGANLIQLSLPDGQIKPGPALDKVLDDLWQQVNPDVVLAFDPKGPLPIANNPDHLAVGAAIMHRLRRGIPRGERVYLYATQQANVLVDITEVIQEKTNSIRAHRSQLVGPDMVVRTWSRGISRLHSNRTPAMYTEAFYRLV
ncbi:MAG TPA: PIG-L deacetylase family protein [Symbiobacteriaceae bacterium]|nr:PIG-L deacetylase family protein [Symbiobacteriaceae bacterium]